MSDSDKNSLSVTDTCGLKCPEPVMLLHAAVRDAQAGERILVKATDPSTERDFAKFCRFLGHELAAFSIDNGIYTYEIIKGNST